MAKNDLIRQRKLRDPDTVGRDIFGKARFAKIYKKCSALSDHYAKAFSSDVEADVVQEELDGCLREIWEDELAPFRERYPELKTFSYDKAKKGWVD